jgi:hypothetical protein
MITRNMTPSCSKLVLQYKKQHDRAYPAIKVTVGRNKQSPIKTTLSIVIVY